MPPKRYFDSTVATDHAVSTASVVDTAKPAPTAARRVRSTPRPQTTLFVSSIPFSATSTDLTTLFSDIGPLRRAFVVTDKESGKSKGVGYVSFAVREDAERALVELQGRSLDGKRKMRIEWATGRPGEVFETPAGIEAEANLSLAAGAGPKKKDGGFERDPDAVRTIVVLGLSKCKPEADSKSIYKRARKIGDVDNVIYPAPASVTAPAPSADVAQIVFRTPNHAMAAVTKLHAHTFKGAQISVVLKKRADSAARLEAHMRPETKAKRAALQKKVDQELVSVRMDKAALKTHDIKPEVNRGSRLIVRNLPFDVTDRDLRAIFLPYGPIYSIDVPQKAGPEKAVVTSTEDAVESGEGSEAGEDNLVEGDAADEKMDVDEPAREDEPKGRTRGRGFAFVWHVSRSDAANAIKSVNGTLIGHGAAERAQVKAAKGKAGREAAKKALEVVTKTAQPARQVAVDWALSKKEWEMKKDESEAEETEAEELESDEDEDSVDEGSDSDSDLDPLEANDDEEEESKSAGDKSDEEAEGRPSLPKPEEGTTLFVRNLPFQATEEELRDLFRSFGPLRYAKVTMDKTTKRPKGTAFICFWQKESADKVIQQVHLVEQEAGTSASNSAESKASKKNPFAAPSVLTADPSAPLTASLSLHGRVLSIVPALERTQAESLAQAAQTVREKNDKRNTFLMREGVPMPGSPLAARLNETEIERRLTAFQVRKAQLTKNPSLFISKTRLSVRQLPLFVTDRVLKRLAEYAVATFDQQVKDCEREALSNDEVTESKRLAEEMHKNRARKATTAEADSSALSKKQQLREKRNAALQRRLLTGKGGFVVVQSKIIRAKDRLDATTGQGRSHGYGFLEMATFADALKVVRFANANGKLRKLMLGWYAEELGMLASKLRAQMSADQSKDAEKEARLHRVERKKAQLEAGELDPEEEGARSGLCVVEFSVENIVTVKRRGERIKNKEGDDRRKRADGDNKRNDGGQRTNTLGKRLRDTESADGKADRGRPKKPRRPETWNQKTSRGGREAGKPGLDGKGNARKQLAEPDTAKPTKQGAVIGSIIGRKRKMRHNK